jgi:hypothetical protein
VIRPAGTDLQHERERGGRTSPPLLLAVVLVALAAALAPASVHADGDPASDSLLFQNVFVPSRSPSPAVTAALEDAASDVFAHGERIKVAVIYEASDLGSIPSLFGHPADYARFLGLELSLWYAGPLLVVMPAGFGIYDGGHTTAAEAQVLQSVPLSGDNPDGLARSASAAVEALGAAGALDSPDVRAPLVTAHPASGKRGKPALLHFDVYDDSGRSAALVRVYDAGSLLATLRSPATFRIGTRHVALRWLMPAKLRSRQLRYCVVASDPAGNHSAPACAPFLRVS